jgi:hypothetical protein
MTGMVVQHACVRALTVLFALAALACCALSWSAAAPAAPASVAPPAAPPSAPSAQPSAPSAPAPATPTPGNTVYNIEVIVFRATSALGPPEEWSAEAGARSVFAGDESLNGASQVGHFIAALPASMWQLGELENRLRSSGTYVPVGHAAWSQTASSWGTRAGFTLQKLGIDVPGLSGTIFLERGQFLHLGMSLTYALPSPPAGLGAAPDTPFTINESRRIRFF